MTEILYSIENGPFVAGLSKSFLKFIGLSTENVQRGKRYSFTEETLKIHQTLFEIIQQNNLIPNILECYPHIIPIYNLTNLGNKVQLEEELAVSIPDKYKYFEEDAKFIFLHAILYEEYKNNNNLDGPFSAILKEQQIGGKQFSIFDLIKTHNSTIDYNEIIHLFKNIAEAERGFKRMMSLINLLNTEYTITKINTKEARRATVQLEPYLELNIYLGQLVNIRENLVEGTNAVFYTADWEFAQNPFFLAYLDYINQKEYLSSNRK